MRASHWTAETSVRASLVATWIGIVLAVIIAAIMPYALNRVSADGASSINADWFRHAITPLYLCLIAGLAALIILLRLLASLSRGEVFTLDNVRRLRGISYCGVAIAIILALTAIFVGPWPIFGGVAAIAAFLALIMRVIKNVIDAARLIKEDNDYTI